MKINEVYQGDCLEVMRGMPDNFVDTVLTDPPYGLQFMGKNWDHGIPGATYWRECLRVAKPGATLMAFGGTRTYHRLASAIEDAGWQIRDCITYFHDGSQAEAALMASLTDEQLAAYLELHYPNHQMSWVYGSGIGLGYDVSKGIDKGEGADREVVRQKVDFSYDGAKRNVKNHKAEMAQSAYGKFNGNSWDQSITAPATPLAAKFDGWKSRLKPAFEPIVVAMKPIEQSYAANAETWGVAGLWIDGGRVETNGEEELQRPERNGTGNVGGWHNYSQPKGLYGTPNGTGRYPANVILDGSETVEAEFAKAGVSVSKIDNKGRGISSKGSHEGYKSKSHNNPDYQNRIGGHNDSGSASRYFQHCPPDTEPARFHYCPKAPPSERATPGNDHPTQKPLSLMRYLAKLTRTPDGGIVLDPFAGSGTTALACIAEKRHYVLIDKEADYAELCRRRIAEYTGREIAPKEVEITKGETTKQLSLW